MLYGVVSCKGEDQLPEILLPFEFDETNGQVRRCYPSCNGICESSQTALYVVLADIKVEIAGYSRFFGH